MDKNQIRKNTITKYVIYKLEEMLSEDNNTSFDTISATIEHIIPQSSAEAKELVLNVGNLMILEKKLNKDCEDYSLKEKYSVYKNSNYHSVKAFLTEYSNKDEFSIQGRSSDIGNKIYSLITEKWKN